MDFIEILDLLKTVCAKPKIFEIPVFNLQPVCTISVGRNNTSIHIFIYYKK